MAIEILTVNESLVVDSRLIADELGIEHATLLRTINKHLDRLERKEPVRFEIDVVKRPQGGTYEVSYCYLNEYQATLLMTFSRNTEQVLDCKEKLVDGFEKAKRTIKEAAPTQSDRIRELEEISIGLKNLEPSVLAEFVRLEQEKQETKRHEMMAIQEEYKMRQEKERTYQREMWASIDPKVAVELLRLEQEKEKTVRETKRLEREQFVRNNPKPSIKKIQAITEGLSQNQKLIQDIALYIEYMENTKGVTPKIRDLQQKFHTRKVVSEDGIAVPINSKILRNLMPDVEALRKVEAQPPHLVLL